MRYFKSAWMLSQTLIHAENSGDFFKSQYSPQVVLRYSELKKSIRGHVSHNWYTKFLIHEIEGHLKSHEFFQAAYSVEKLVNHMTDISK